MKVCFRLLAIATAACAVGAAGTTAGATPPSVVVGPDGTTAAVFSYADAIRERVFVPVAGVDQDADGIDDRMAIDIVRPQETDAGLKVPAIIDPSPYYTSIGRGNEGEFLHTTAAGTADRFPLYYDNYFVPRGYAFIAAQALGTAFSTGCPLHGGPGDVAGFKAVIDWLRGRVPGYDSVTGGSPVTASWDSGKNALIGKSYDGTFANGVAATGVEGLTTIVPISAISDWYDYSRMGGIRFNTHYPASLSSSIDQNQGAATLGVVPPDRFNACLASRAAMSAVDGDADGDVNQFWLDRDYTLGVGNVHASVFAVHGLNDDNVRTNEFSRWWDGLAANGVPRKLWLSQEGHVDPFDFRRSAWVDTLHRWFDYWLQGVPNGIMSEPRVDIETGPSMWETQANWPLPGTAPVDLYLQGTAAGSPGALGIASGGAMSSLTFTDANLSESNYLSLATTESNRLLFLSPPLLHDLRLSGAAIVDVLAKLSATQSNVAAFLVDYGGGVERVARSGNGGVHNLATSSCWGDATATDNACYADLAEDLTTPTVWRVSKGILDSSNRASLVSGEASPVVPGQQVELRWPTLPNDFTFPAGHRIGVVVGANFAGFSSVRGTTGAAITVDTLLSKVSLPVVGGRAAAIAAGLGDTTPPVLHLPAPTVDATSASGAAVTYSATATDLVDPSPVVVCTPPSGAVFPIGTTTAACSATDASGNAAQGSFPVHVRGGDEQLTRLLADAIAAGARPQITNRIPIVQGHLAAGRTTNGCHELDALISALAVAPANGLDAAHAAALTADVRRIAAVYGCALRER